VNLLVDAERYKRVEDLLQGALRLPPDRRDEFRRGACSGDAALEQEVRSLLSSDRKTKNFLRRPAIEVAGQGAAALQGDSKLDDISGSLEGRTISHCRVIANLGDGGMGVVCEAEDLKFGRVRPEPPA